MKSLFLFDTNSLLSALILPKSTPRQAFTKARKLGNIIFSDSTFLELDEVIRRAKFDKYIDIENRLEFLANIKKTSLFFEVSHSISDCRDPKDNKFLELALSANVQIIITGDSDLLVLTPFRTIPIITASQFLML